MTLRKRVVVIKQNMKKFKMDFLKKIYSIKNHKEEFRAEITKKLLFFVSGKTPCLSNSFQQEKEKL